MHFNDNRPTVRCETPFPEEIFLRWNFNSLFKLGLLFSPAGLVELQHAVGPAHDPVESFKIRISEVNLLAGYEVLPVAATVFVATDGVWLGRQSELLAERLEGLLQTGRVGLVDTLGGMARVALRDATETFLKPSTSLLYEL